MSKNKSLGNYVSTKNHTDPKWGLYAMQNEILLRKRRRYINKTTKPVTLNRLKVIFWKIIESVI